MAAVSARSRHGHAICGVRCSRHAVEVREDGEAFDHVRPEQGLLHGEAPDGVQQPDVAEEEGPRERARRVDVTGIICIPRAQVG